MDLESRKNELGLLLNLEVRARWLEEWLDITVCGSVLSVQFFLQFSFFTILHIQCVLYVECMYLQYACVVSIIKCSSSM